jgi:hypothetical protein
METPQSGRNFLNKNCPSKRLYLKMAKELSKVLIQMVLKMTIVKVNNKPPCLKDKEMKSMESVWYVHAV